MTHRSDRTTPVTPIVVDEALTRQVAHLARLELSDEEARLFAAQLAKVIGYVDQLGEVDVTGIAELRHPLETETPLRDDIARPFSGDGARPSKIMASAAETLHGGFKVPQIL